MTFDAGKSGLIVFMAQEKCAAGWHQQHFLRGPLESHQFQRPSIHRCARQAAAFSSRDGDVDMLKRADTLRLQQMGRFVIVPGAALARDLLTVGSIDHTAAIPRDHE